MKKFILRLLGLGPDVLLVDDQGRIQLHKSRIVAGRRIVEDGSAVLILQDDGTVRGSHWIKTWEAI